MGSLISHRHGAQGVLVVQLKVQLQPHCTQRYIVFAFMLQDIAYIALSPQVFAICTIVGCVLEPF